jgi:hypothetical protein
MTITGKSLALAESRAVGKLPIMPTWAPSATADTWPGEFETGKALARLDSSRHGEIAAACEAADAARQPMNRDRLVQRLTAVGMVMAPNRPPAEASVWVRETARLLGDVPEDILCEAIDALQKRLKFLPTVAEIREIAEPRTEARNRVFFRLDAMRRYLQSGQPIPRIGQSAKSPYERRGEPMSAEDTASLNEYLESAGSCFRYSEDGTRRQVKEYKPVQAGLPPRRMPTRQDYIDMGVDPEVLDQNQAGQAAGTHEGA